MKKSVIFNDVEFTAIKYIYSDDEAVQDGVLVHDLKDEFNNGDGVTNGTLPVDEDDAMNLLSECIVTCFTIDEYGIYHID